MYAIIEVGGKQYSVKEQDIIDVERQAGKEGQEITLGRVLLISKDKKLEVGQPYIKEARVMAKILRQIRAPKVVSFKYQRRKSFHRKKGHRQQLTCVQIKDIKLES